MSSEPRSEWRLVSPMGLAKVGVPNSKAAAAGGRRVVLGFLSNHKPNATPLQRMLAVPLADAFPDLEIRFYEKANSSLGAPGELLDRVAADCGLVVNGTGD
jgi:hypothetical protein